MKQSGRQRFFFNLGALGTSMLLIVAAAAFGANAAKWVGVGIGIAECALSLMFVAVVLHERHLAGHPELRVFGRGVSVWSFLAGVMASVTVWEIIQAAVFQPYVSRWLTLANGLLIAGLACAGLIAHELSSERVVHVLEVIERPTQS